MMQEYITTTQEISHKGRKSGRRREENGSVIGTLSVKKGDEW